MSSLLAPLLVLLLTATGTQASPAIGGPCVVIDAAHDGSSTEGSVTLPLAFELAARLRADSIGVTMTRESGSSLDSPGRLATVDRSGCQLVISLHVDPGIGSTTVLLQHREGDVAATRAATLLQGTLVKDGERRVERQPMVNHWWFAAEVPVVLLTLPDLAPSITSSQESLIDSVVRAIRSALG